MGAEHRVEEVSNKWPQPSALGAAAISDVSGEEGRLPLRCAIRALTGCVWRTAVLAARGRIRQPAGNVGRSVRFADGTSPTIYRETVIDRPPAAEPAVLVVCFRLRGVRRTWAHALFRTESELNTVLFAGFPGLVSKLWLHHDENGFYRGFYQWDGVERAVAYARALWWVLAVVSQAESIHYAVLPGLDRDEVLQNPAQIDSLIAAPRGWWRPTAADGRTA